MSAGDGARREPPRQAAQGRGQRRSPASLRRAHAPGRRLRGGAGGGAGAGLHPGRRRAHCLGKGPGARRRCTRGPLPARRPPAQALVSDPRRFCRPCLAGVPLCPRSAPGRASASASLGRPTVPAARPPAAGGSRRGASSGNAGCSGCAWQPQRPPSPPGAAGSPRRAVPCRAVPGVCREHQRSAGRADPALPHLWERVSPGPRCSCICRLLSGLPLPVTPVLPCNLNALSDAEFSSCHPVTLFFSLQWTAVRRGDR